MNIYVNDSPKEYPQSLRIPDLLEALQILNTTGIALALNGEVISRMRWADTQLKENDRIVILHAARGG
jgi:sulfur carrier protein